MNTKANTPNDNTIYFNSISNKSNIDRFGSVVICAARAHSLIQLTYTRRTYTKFERPESEVLTMSSSFQLMQCNATTADERIMHSNH